MGQVEHILALSDDAWRVPVMDHFGGHKADSTVVMLCVVPAEERGAESACIFDTAKSLWKVGAVF